MKSLLLIIITSVFMSNAFSFSAPTLKLKPRYLPDADECPAADGVRNFYLRLPLMPDLPLTAVHEIFPQHQQFHTPLKEKFGKRFFSLYVELLKPYDPAKEMLLLIAGGPGLNHANLLHNFGDYKFIDPNIFENYNVMAMDHRGTGCSRPLFPDEWPTRTLLMRYAAGDIEAVRQYFKADTINIFSVSYGTFLAQTYALMYPEVKKRLFLKGALSSYEDVVEADQNFEKLVISGLPSIEDREHWKNLTRLFPALAEKFLHWAVGPTYSYQDQKQFIADTLKEVLELALATNIKQAEEKLSTEPMIMDALMRNIICTEIIPYFPNAATRFHMFPSVWRACKEFEELIEPFDYRPFLGRVKDPVFIWAGEHDHVTPAVASKKIKELIPSSFLYIDNDSGHVVSELKKSCLVKLTTLFFAGASEEELLQIEQSPICTTRSN